MSLGRPVHSKPSDLQPDVSLSPLLQVLVLSLDKPKPFMPIFSQAQDLPCQVGSLHLDTCLPIVLSPDPWPSCYSQVPDLIQEPESHRQEAIDSLCCVVLPEQIPEGDSSIWRGSYCPFLTPTGLLPVPETLMVPLLPYGKRVQEEKMGWTQVCETLILLVG